MYGMFIYMYLKNCQNVGKYSIHGESVIGIDNSIKYLQTIESCG